MVRVGGFLKTQNRIRRQRARGRFISPYQVGGTIFGKSTMVRYPLMHTSSRLGRRWMKGGTIFGTSTRMQVGDPMKVLSAAQEKAMMDRWLKKRMKGGNLFGNLFGKLKKRIQIDFPHRPFPSAHPIHDGYRLRKGIKRGRR